MRYLHIDAFTEEAFKGNSAGVVVYKHQDLDDEFKQRLASEFRHSETAFVWVKHNEIILRWFTPLKEVDLCGHATLAAAFALWSLGEKDIKEKIEFQTRSGILSAATVNGKIELDFPQQFVNRCEANSIVNKGLGIEPIFTGKNDKRYLLEIDDPGLLRTLNPDFGILGTADLGAFIVTCKSDVPEFDFLSRFFAPYVGINEDPVTGSAHCYLAPYWGSRLNKKVVIGFQASKRTGIVECELLEHERVKLRGNAILLFSTTLNIG